MQERYSNKMTSRRTREHGFTLVELMVSVAIVGILTAVAIPAYINHVNRSKQSEATGLLMTARLEMEEFYTDNRHYANTIQCLPSMVASANTICLRNCSSCNATSTKPKLYTYSVALANANSYRIAATRKIYAWAQTDVVTISSSTDTPTVANTDALSFSVFQWLFE